jgi:hypothetical protein
MTRHRSVWCFRASRDRVILLVRDLLAADRILIYLERVNILLAEDRGILLLVSDSNLLAADSGVLLLARDSSNVGAGRVNLSCLLLRDILAAAAEAVHVLLAERKSAVLASVDNLEKL